MKRVVSKSMWTLGLLLAGAVPAYANNPPAPDGMLSIILLFPVAILGFRLAGAKLNEKEMKWKTFRGVALGVSALLTAAGTGIAIVPLLILLCYGLLRGVQTMVRGQGAKRFLAGSGMILFTFFAVANYLASLENYPSESRYSYAGAAGLRTIVTAELEFQKSAKLDANKNGVPEYGSLQQLLQAGLIDARYLRPPKDRGYRFTLILAGDPARDEKEFFVYASPVHYGTPGRTISLVDAFRPHGATTTFAADESGVIRRADLGGSRAVTREESESWQRLEY